MNIHPTAIVHAGAKLAADVEIGPYSVVGPACDLADGCRLGAHVILENRVVLGPRSYVGHGSVIGSDPQDGSFDRTRTDSGVLIGSDNVIREHVTIHRATQADGNTMVGDGNFIMTGCHLAHDNVVGNGVIMANNALTAGHVQIGDRCFVGGGSVFHQFIRIGTLAMVRGGCRFSKDIPPYLVGTGTNGIAGLNVVGLRRAGIGAASRIELKKAFRLLFTSGLNVSQALAASEGESWGAEAAHLFDFVRTARQRGICDHKGIAESDDD